MSLSEEYMRSSIDLFASIDYYVQAANKELSDIKDGVNKLNNTMMEFKGVISSPAEGIKDDNILMKELIPRIDKIISLLSGGGAEGSGDEIKQPEGKGIKLSEMSSDIASFFVNIASASKSYKKAKNVMAKMSSDINNFIMSLIQNLSDEDIDKAGNVANIVEIVGNSMVTFAKASALSTPLMAIGYLGVVMLSSAIKVLAKALDNVGENYENIMLGTKAVNKIGVSIMVFSGSLALSAFAMSSISPQGYLGLLTMFTIMPIAAFAYNIIGKHSENINKGSFSVGLMGLSLFAFSSGLSYASEQMEDVSLSNLMTLSLSLSGMALIYGIAGKFWSNILLGSLAFGAIGLSMMLMAPQISTMAETIENFTGSVYQIPVVLGAIGTAFALAGIPAVAGFIVLGAAALGAAGGALWVIGKGVGEFVDAIKGTDDNIGTKISDVLKGVVTGFGKSFEELSIVEVATLPMKIPLVIGMGLALGTFSQGLAQYKKNASDWTVDDSMVVEETITSLSKAFSLAGSTEGMTKIFGFPVGSNNVERGIESTMLIGKNLSILADGIMAWKQMDLTEEDVQVIANNISRVLNVIPGIFAEIGQRERGSSNQMDIMGVKIGVPFTSTDTELGIETTMEIGENLKNLADGVLAWKNMALSPEDLQSITDNISRVLNVIPGVFATIGQRERGSTGTISMFGMSFSNPFSSGDTELGIESTMKMGENLKNLSDGVLSWKDFDIGTIEIVKKNIATILNVIPQLFADIGSQDKETEGFFPWSDSDMERGIEIVQDVSEPLQNIANLINSFKEIENPEQRGKEIGLAVKNIISGLLSFSTTEGVTDFLDDMIDPLSELPDVIADINDAISDHIEIISSMDPSKMEAFNKWANSMSLLSGNASVIRETSKSAFNIPEIDKNIDYEKSVYKPKQLNQNNNLSSKQQNGDIKALEQKIDLLVQAMNMLLSSQQETTDVNKQVLQALRSGIKIKDDFR